MNAHEPREPHGVRPTYAEVGATRGERLPPGYHHLRHRTLIGHGRTVFEAAGAAVMEWRMHRAIPVRLTAPQERAAPGVDVTVLLGVGGIGLRAPARVIWTAEDPTRTGFGYGTLPGHPECGEESFLVHLADDGRVWFTVTAFSRPGSRLTRAAGPLVPVLQKLYARRCGQVLRRLARPRE
ncbi:DUF1990 domain-containing protein [Streptomyces sp. RB6PN25]|uniref:DUF1990 domain-containing protein n=1 Tax=Streptomyces humicola TaxID=2953240 RepID=A0ABT1PSJ0_9ACTN|nr:DUF1990 domain-containing protein [Streptomyces humicola]MCQ4080646.1 DUF1990 domain-containing protein [Streptomyces humicola]